MTFGLSINRSMVHVLVFIGPLNSLLTSNENIHKSTQIISHGRAFRGGIIMQ